MADASGSSVTDWIAAVGHAAVVAGLIATFGPAVLGVAALAIAKRPDAGGGDEGQDAAAGDDEGEMEEEDEEEEAEEIAGGLWG